MKLKLFKVTMVLNFITYICSLLFAFRTISFSIKSSMPETFFFQAQLLDCKPVTIPMVVEQRLFFVGPPFSNITLYHFFVGAL
jgi:hypothetical protein